MFVCVTQSAVWCLCVSECLHCECIFDRMQRPFPHPTYTSLLYYICAPDKQNTQVQTCPVAPLEVTGSYLNVKQFLYPSISSLISM